MGTQLQVTFTGKNFAELIEGAKAFATAGDPTFKTSAAAPTKTAAPKTTKKAAPVVEDEDLDLSMDDAEEIETQDEETEELSFDAEELDEEEVKPAKKAKLTIKDVNEAASAHAKHHGGKKKTLEILNKNFKVKSILELKPEQWAPAIKALAIK